MALTAEQIAEARKEGYTDAEILQHYAASKGIDLKAARDEGYSDSEILSHFSGAEVEPQTQQAPQTESMLSSPELSGALGAGAGAVYSAKTLPVKAAKAFGTAVANRLPGAQPTVPTPSPSTYTTPAGINVEQTPGGMHPGAVGNAQFNVEQQQANKLHQNVPPGFEAKGTSRILTPVGMQEPAAALGGAPSTTRGSSILAQKRAEGWPIVRETTQAVKSVAPAIGGAAKNIMTSSPVAGAMAGYNLQDAMNRYREGDVTGATIGGVGAASQLLPRKGRAGLIKTGLGLGAAGLNALRGEPQGYAGGGKADLLMEGIKAAKKIFTPKETQIVRASEALGPHEGKWLNVTQSDRMRSTGGDLGGPGFSRFQTIDPRYAEAQAAWGVGKKPTASAIVNVNKRFPEGQAIWSPMIGSETQHHSNQHVFDMLSDEFKRQARMGKLTPELRERINQRLQTAPAYKGRFDPAFDIANPEMLTEAGTTFDRRGALAEVMSGQGVGGQKGTIIDYPGIMQEMTDPMTIGAPTHSIGTRLFNLSGDVEHRPDLHSAFPYILKGEDMGVAFNPVPKELALSDWMTQFKEFKGRTPGYYDMTRTVPSQQITDKYLRSLEEAGHAEGGAIHMEKGGLTALAKKALKKYGVGLGLTAPFAAEAGQDVSKGNMGSALDLASGFLPAPAMAAYMGLAPSETAPMHMDQYPGRQGTDPLAGSGSVMEGYVPGMAGGGDVMKALKKVMGAGEGVGMRTIEGSPHTYPPIATGPWMRDYTPSTGAGLPTTRQGWDDLAAQHQAAQNKVDYSMGRTGPSQPQQIQYMGKYLSPTPERMAAQKAQRDDAIRSAIENRKAQWLAQSRARGIPEEQIMEEMNSPWGAPWMP